MLGARVIDLDQDQPGLKPRHVQRQHAGRVDAEWTADLDQPIPQRNALLGVDPQLIAQVARVAGAADIQLDLAGLGGPSVVVAQVGPVGVGQGGQDGSGERALEGNGCSRFGNIVDRDVEAA